MSLTSCLRKAGDALDARDKAQILSKSRDYRRSGMGASEAAIKAVEDQLAVVRAELASAIANKPPEPAKPTTWEMRASGTLAIKGDQTAILEKLKAGGVTKTMIADGGIMVAKTQAEKARAVLEGKPQEEPTKPLSVGVAPGSTELVTVKDGIIHIGKHEAIDFDSGEPVKIKAGATDADIKKALRDAGALSKRQKFYDGEKDALTQPSREEVIAQQDRAANAPALDDKAAIDREAEHQTLTQPVAPEQRKDAGGDMFAREKAQAELDKKNAGKPKDDNGTAPMFSRGELRRSDKPPRTSETKRTAIDRAVQKLTSDWLRKPAVHVIDGMDEAPDRVYKEWQRQESQGASGEPEGFHYRGDVYLLAPHMKSMDDVRRVLFHESLGHFGLRGVFGDTLKPILAEVAAQRPELIAAKAEQYGLDITKPSDRLIAAEEVLAEMAQSRPDIGFVRKAIAAIRTWLRKHGIVKTMSDDEILRNYLLPARGFVERGRESKASGGAGGETRFSRTTAADTAEKPKDRKPLPGAKFLDAMRENKFVHEAQMLVAPMGAGNQKARAVAQTFANDMRVARTEWARMDETLAKQFTDAQRKAMWEAADEENVQRQKQAQDMNYQRPTGVGLDRLDAKERATVERLHSYGEELLQRAKDVGMFEGEGLPYWTPRMAVMIGEDGDVGKIPPDYAGPRMVTDGSGKNLTTNSPNLKHRKYLTTEETEAAASALAKQKGGAKAEVIRDIRTMPLAMARLERAIAGRELVNQVKAIGLATGEETVSTTSKPGYAMIAHPAFTTYAPRFEKGEGGKLKAVTDANGDTVFDSHPLYIRKDFEGPLRAVMSANDGEWYKGYMLAKSKAMSAIMFSPAIHNMVIYGRALAYSPTKVGTTYLYWKGHALNHDMDFVRQAVKDGVVPIGFNKTTVMDATDLSGKVEKMGAWGDPGESFVNLSMQKLGNAIRDGWGDKTKKGMDAVGDFWHHTLLWKQIQALQWGIYADAKQNLAGKGLSADAAGALAAHFANRYAGVVAQENMGELARKAANLLLFSRSFNITNVGVWRDALFGLPDGLKAKLYEAAGKREGDRAAWIGRRKAMGALALDLGFAIVATSLMQDLVRKLKDDDTLGDGRGYLDRLKDMVEGIKERPLDRSSYNPYRLSSTWSNEAGKKDRVDFGADVGERHQYMRLPTGKAIEDIIGWVLHPADTFSAKMAPLPKAMWQVIQNDKGFGVPVRDPNGGTMKGLWESVEHILKAQMPADAMKQAYEAIEGNATDLDKKKLTGNVTGFTFSQGHPNGPEGAAASVTEQRFEASRKYTMQLVKDDLKRGDEDKAVERMEAIGMSSSEIKLALRRAQDAGSGLSEKARKNFERRANDDERREMGLQRNR